MADVANLTSLLHLILPTENSKLFIYAYLIGEITIQFVTSREGNDFSET
ncbi:MAG: hypothetical protein ACKPJO_20040 [Dolichospermum sp.]